VITTFKLLPILAAGALVLVACSSPEEPDASFDVGAATSYLATDCALQGPPTEVADPPVGDVAPGVAVGEGAEGVPVIYVAADAAPATELQAVTILPGNGPSAALGNDITVNYCGVGLSTGTLFDSSWARGEPITFQLVEGGLIAGWTQGVPGMQLGEQRLLVIPSDLAYGSNPPPGIEPDESLVFVVELRDISGEG
jgi:peptidylprolyl isomerase